MNMKVIISKINEDTFVSGVDDERIIIISWLWLKMGYEYPVFWLIKINACIFARGSDGESIKMWIYMYLAKDDLEYPVYCLLK